MTSMPTDDTSATRPCREVDDEIVVIEGRRAHWFTQLEHDRFRKWWGQHRAWRARLVEQDRQPACYSLISVKRTTAFARWILGMSSAATVLAFAIYIQTYLSILSIMSIKDDCVSQEFIANANLNAAVAVVVFLASGLLALLAITWPAGWGIGRNLLRSMKAQNLPPLQPGQELDGWSEFHVNGRVVFWQKTVVVLSALIFFGLIFRLVFTPIGDKPEGVRAELHKFELRCLQRQPPDPGYS